MRLIVIIDYGMGNIHSISSALRFLGYNPLLSRKERDILSADRLILPGVGSFFRAMKNIREIGLDRIFKKAVTEKKIPLLGICLGMQLLFERGTEDRETEGLGFIEGRVERFNIIDRNVKIPHIGFSKTEIIKDSKLFYELSREVDFYYNHSYKAVTSEDYIIAAAYNGERFPAAVQMDNVFGTQFHPELSQSNGLRVLKNFLELNDAL